MLRRMQKMMTLWTMTMILQAHRVMLSRQVRQAQRDHPDKMLPLMPGPLSKSTKRACGYSGI
jgi:hypothetical protein